MVLVLLLLLAVGCSDLLPPPEVPDGLPGAQARDAESLPLPGPGRVLPTMLGDGTPVFVVQHPDGGVDVVDARSPHWNVSGLVGWCPDGPYFLDSPGSARFWPDGSYAFGPSPTGLATYQVRIDDDGVVVTDRLAGAARPREPNSPDRGWVPGSGCQPALEAIEGRDIGPDGHLHVEDYTGHPGWRQHDLAAWPRRDVVGLASGYAREPAGAVALLGGPEVEGLVGDALVLRLRGQLIWRGWPPGAVRAVGSD